MDTTELLGSQEECDELCREIETLDMNEFNNEELAIVESFIVQFKNSINSLMRKIEDEQVNRSDEEALARKRINGYDEDV